MIDFVLNKDLVKYGKEFGFKEVYPVKMIKVESLRDLNKKTKERIGVIEANKTFLRKIFENKKVDLVLGLEKIEEKDSLHHKNSGLNQVLCKLAKENKISIGVSFYDILHAKEKSKLLGRIVQNMELCKKYKVNVVLGSFARDKYDMRMKKDLEAFGRLIGIDKINNAKIFKLKEFTDIKVIK